MDANKTINQQSANQPRLQTIDEQRSQQDQTIQRIVSTSPIHFNTQNHQYRTLQKSNDLTTLNNKKLLFQNSNPQKVSITHPTKNSRHRRNKTQMSKHNKSQQKDPVYNCLFVPFLQTKSFDFKRSLQDISKIQKSGFVPRKKIKSLPKAQSLNLQTLPVQNKTRYSFREKKVSLPQISKKQSVNSSNHVKKGTKSGQNILQTFPSNKQQAKSVENVNRYVNKKVFNKITSQKNEKERLQQNLLQKQFIQTKNVKQFKALERQSKLKSRRKKQKQWKQINYLQLKTCYYQIDKKIASNSISYSSDPLIKNQPNGIKSQRQNLKKDILLYQRNVKIPKFPHSIEEVSILIKNFLSLKKNKIQLNELIKSKHFVVKFIDKEFLYFGQTENQVFHGYGILVKPDYVFQGEWKKGQKIVGVQSRKGVFYEGQFKDNKKQGFGISYWNNGSDQYSGQWKNGLKNGNGVWKNIDGDQYIGQWTNGKVQGFGVHTTVDGQKYQGYFSNFLKQGKGKQVFPNGDSYQGNYFQGKPDGYGVYKFHRGQSVYEGNFSNGLRQGKGKFVVPNLFKYQGNFSGDNVQGYGKINYINNDCYIGNFKQGLKDGKGSLHRLKQKVILNGLWRNGQFFEKQGKSNLKLQK